MPDKTNISVDEHYDTNADVLADSDPGRPICEAVIHRGPDDLWTDLDRAAATRTDPTPQDEPWNPFTPSNTDTKENNTMSNNGEITGPAAVKQFHDDFKSSADTTVTITDTLEGLAADLEARAKEVDANIGSTETAAAGMTQLGMKDAAGAAASLMETQQTIQAALAKAAAALKESAAVLTDQILTTHQHLAAIKTAYEAQMRMKDERAGAGLGNLAHDAFLDDND